MSPADNPETSKPEPATSPKLSGMPRAVVERSANGLRVQANNFLFDGIDNNESLVNTIVFFVDPDAIQEFRVDTNVAPLRNMVARAEPW